MSTLAIHAPSCDCTTAPSLRDETPRPVRPGDFLELDHVKAQQDRVSILVAVLVALVHHRRSYSVTLSNRTGAFESPHQIRGSLRWGVTERD